jgi:UPF0176 protein
VKVKPELISLGQPAHPEKHVGTYVSPGQWNKIISDPDVLTIDARNSYETYIGSFKGAVDPNTRTFKQLPKVTKELLEATGKKKIASFCTGGIRCEKYTAWLKDQGVEEVYHLEGGILRYLEEVPESDSLWEGSCYVFDERVAVKHGLKQDEDVNFCLACGHTLKEEDRQHPDYVADEHCPYCETYPASNTVSL